MTTTMVRYRVASEEEAQANAALVRAVYAELAERRPGGFRYETFVMDDGVTFVHVATTDGRDAPLPALASFQRFRAELEARCAEPPAFATFTSVGSYPGWLPG